MKSLKYFNSLSSDKQCEFVLDLIESDKDVLINFIKDGEEQKFELLYNSKTHMQYTKDLGGDGFTLLHVFLKPDGSFSGELEEVLLESDGSQYTITTKEPVEEDESLQQFLNRI